MLIYGFEMFKDFKVNISSDNYILDEYYSCYGNEQAESDIIENAIGIGSENGSENS